jgi:hypothetical protein
VTPAERSALIARYAEGPARLRTALESTPPEMRKWRPQPGEFSVHEIIVHCADSETNSHGRIRYLLAEEAPTITGYDPDNWARAFNYLDHPIEAAMAAVDAVRANTVPVIRAASDEDWAKCGTHSESGAYSAEDWLRIYAAHCHEHADQITEVLATWRAAGKPS